MRAVCWWLCGNLRCVGGRIFKSEDKLDSGDAYANESNIQRCSFEATYEVGFE